MATVVAAASRRISIPDSVVLVVVGLWGAVLFPQVRVAITPALVLGVFVPGLVFAAAYAIDWADLRPVLAPIVALAVPGVLVSALVVAYVLQLGTELPLALAFVVGAVTAATDPVAVVATMGRLRVPARLRTLVEGESLLNDGTGLVLFAVAVRAAVGGIAAGEAVLLFVVTVVVSAVAGVAGGLLAARAMRLTDERTIQLATSLVVAYGTYEIADAIGLSGILATVIAGITLGTAMRRGGLAEAARDIEELWEVVAFVLTSLVFLLIGFAVAVPALFGATAAIALGTVAVLGARGLIVYLPIVALRLARPRRTLPKGWPHVIFWSGLRGAVALAAALSLPVDFPRRELVAEVSFGIVLATLLLQGATAPLVVTRALAAIRS